MLNFIYGRSGSGKTTYVNSLVSSLVKQDGEQVVYVVPEQFSFTSERKMLELLGPVDCNKVEIVMSFTHLADSVYKLYGANHLPSLDASSKSILMSLALDSVTNNLEVYSNKTQYLSFVQEMTALSTEFRRGECAPDKLSLACGKIEDELLRKKLSDITLILDAYDSLLDGKFYDPDDRLTVLSKVLEEYRFFEGKTVFIDGFTGYTQQEYSIIEKMMIQSKQVYICVCSDKLYENENDSFSVFSPSYKTIKKLISIAKKNNVPVSDGKEIVCKNYKSEDIEFLSHNFLQNSDERFENSKNITIISAKNRIEECDYVACEVKRLLKNGYRCREIAIVSRDSDSYEDYMKTALEKCSVPVFFDRRSSVYLQPLCSFIRYALDMAQRGINHDNIFAYLKTGLAGLSLEEISEIENYVFMWGIKSSGWKKPFCESPYGFGDGLRPGAEEKLDKLNELRRKIIRPLLKFFDKLKGNIDAKTFSKSVYELLCDVGANENLKNIAVSFEESGDSETALIQQRVWDCVMSTLNDIANIIGENKKDVSEYNTILNIALASQDLGKIPQGLDEVIVGDVMKTRMDAPKVVFVLGVNEDVFPSYGNSGATFSEREKVLLKKVGIEFSDTLEQRYKEERFLGYKTFCAPKDKLYISYSRFAVNSDEMQPSEFVTEIEQLFDNVRITDLSKAAATDFVESEKTAFRLAAEKWRDNDSLSASLKQVFSQKEDYSSTIECIEEMQNKTSRKINSPEVAGRLFGSVMYESPSRVETYSKCPFLYFCRYAIKAQKLEKSEIDPRQRGNVIHYCLEKLIKNIGIRELCQMDDTQLQKNVREVLVDYANESMGGLENKSDRFEKLYFTFERTVLNLIKRLVEEFSECRFEPVDFELAIDKDGAVKPYELVAPNGTVISMRGKVDRVDSCEMNGKNYIRVVDYKTGKKDFVLSDVFYGLNMQMLVYLFTIWENGAEKYGDVIPAGVLYMPSGEVDITASRDDDDEEIRVEQNKKGKMKGVVLNSIPVIDAMGERFISAKINSKTGEATGDILTLKQLRKLKKTIDERLISMAINLHNGKIEACPIEGEDYKDICAYCNYKDVCLIEDEDERKSVCKSSFSDTVRILDETEDEENG